MAQTSAAKGAAQNKSANGIDPRRQAALDTALAQVEKSFGKGSAMRLGDRPEQDVEVIPTGSLALDMALGIGGLPKGRIVEIYGPGILRQDHTGVACGGQCPEKRWRRRVHRCGTCA